MSQSACIEVYNSKLPAKSTSVIVINCSESLSCQLSLFE